MKAPRLELADIVREYGAAYLARYGKATFSQQRRVLKDIALCRTAALGGHVWQCDRCGHTEVCHDSCRNRHCPKCQAAARAEWMEARAQDLLETVEYYHAVFTLPDELGPVALQNKEVVYSILFRSVAETFKTIARDPKHLDADIGFLAILHTWGQRSTIMLISTVSSPVAASRQIVRDGFRAVRASSFRCECSALCSRRSSSSISTRPANRPSFPFMET